MDQRIKTLIESLRTLDHEAEAKYNWWPQETIDTLEKIAIDPDSEKIWNALDKRVDIAQKRHEQILLRDEKSFRLPDDDDDWASKASETNLELEALRLADHVWGCIHDNQFSDSASVAERKALARKANDAISTLKLCLSKLLYDLDGDRFWILDKYQREFGKECAKAALSECYQGYPAKIPFTEDISIASQAAVVMPIEYLDTLRETVDEWGKRVPLAKRPNAPNSDRLRLIRFLTNYFRKHYGTPLRSQVLIVVGVFFDTTCMSESDIAKLAP